MARACLSAIFRGPRLGPADRGWASYALKKVTEDIDNMRFNTAVSAMMILVRHLGALPETPRESAKALALLVSPFAPHIGEELWQRLGAKDLLAYEPWPAFDADLVKDDVIEIGVQVNGKARASSSAVPGLAPRIGVGLPMLCGGAKDPGPARRCESVATLAVDGEGRGRRHLGAG